jgi:MoaA/NifB/PqqE/SkfB family radical SAM enzyme
MEMRSYRKTIDDLRSASALETIAFWGIGEPLLHPEIVEMISLAKGLGVKTELVTNGLLLDAKTSERLADVLDVLVVSVDGVSPESYESIRSGGNLSAVMENIGYLNRLRSRNGRNRPEIGVEFVATRGNLSELPKLRDLAHSMEAAFIFVTNVLPYTESFKDQILYWLAAGSSCFPVPERSWEYPEVVLPAMDDRPEQIEAVKGLLRNNGIVNPALKDSFVEAHCPFVWEGSASICCDGSVSPCIALMHSYTCFVLGREKEIRRYALGNIGSESILSIWNGDEFKAFRRRVMRFEFSPCVNCGGCEFAEGNEEDCFGNTFPVCGDCLWARGVILCP